MATDTTGYEIDLEAGEGEATHAFRSLTPDFGEVRTLGEEFDGLEALLIEGCKAYAGTLVDYDSYSGDSAYLDEIDRRIAEFRILGIRKAGEARRWLADAVYPDDGGGWTDNVMAVDVAEARFQARWTCAVNMLAAHGIHDLTLKAVSEEGFADEVGATTISYAHEEPVKTDEALACLAAIVRDPTWQAFADARAMLAIATTTFPDTRPAPEARTDRTFAMIKSGAVARGSVEGILKVAIGLGFAITRLRRERLSRAKAEAFYAEHAGRPYFEGLIASVTEDDVVLLELAKPGAVAAWRHILGATDPTRAEAGTIRAAFGGPAMPDNAAHGADCDEAAAREASFMFGPLP